MATMKKRATARKQPAAARKKSVTRKVEVSVPGPHILTRVDHPQGARAARLLARRAAGFLVQLGLLDRELSLVITTDTRIRRLNREWREKDEATDVLSFPAGPSPGIPGEPIPLGDVVISLDTAKRVARAEKRKLDDELTLYLAHGILHLLGYDHQTPREAAHMSKAEKKLLGASGMLQRSGTDRTGAP